MKQVDQSIQRLAIEDMSTPPDPEATLTEAMLDAIDAEIMEAIWQSCSDDTTYSPQYLPRDTVKRIGNALPLFISGHPSKWKLLQDTQPNPLKGLPVRPMSDNPASYQS